MKAKRNRLSIAALAGTFLFGSIGVPAAGAPTSSSGTEEWLETMNAYRAMAGLSPVTEEPAWSEGGRLHARYMVKTGEIGHDEDPSSEWYTPEGAEAAANGNVAVFSSTDATDADAIAAWMQGPFHGVGILDSALVRSGFGSFRDPAADDFQTGATLDVIRGLDAPPSASPAMWPGPGTTIPWLAYDGGESPDPLASCPGYSEPTGPPIYLLLPAQPSVTEHAFSSDGVQLDHCVFDGTDYQNPDSSEENLGRDVLGGRNAVILMARDPLDTDSTYEVSIESGGQVHSWSFATSEGGQGPAEASRSLSVFYESGASLTVHGTVFDGEVDVACESSVPVKLQRKRPNRWKNVASDSTNGNGKFRMTAARKNGRYRVKAVPVTVDDTLCLKATSDSFTVRP